MEQCGLSEASIEGSRRKRSKPDAKTYGGTEVRFHKAQPEIYPSKHNKSNFRQIHTLGHGRWQCCFQRKTKDFAAELSYVQSNTWSSQSVNHEVKITEEKLDELAVLDWQPMDTHISLLREIWLEYRPCVSY